ncbi:hypothetical protein AD998_20330 [bacterium 336/3]|nr:hypothetical protein AD998_20330 [bacterium 336/3]
MFSYSFGVSFNLNDNSKKAYIGLGSSEPQYPMLSYLSQYNSISAANEVIEELSAVISGEKEFWGWGTDFCSIVSYKKTSLIEHHINPQNGEWSLEPDFQINIPTSWLLQMFKDWRIFLENNPIELYS